MTAATVAASLAAGGYIVDAVFYAIPILAAVGRMYWWYHWAGDCIAGALLGNICVKIVLATMGGYGSLQGMQWLAGVFLWAAALAAVKYIGKGQTKEKSRIQSAE